jgi:ADP-dependent NAD(P)H-hydrate dehydratase / NAD(P)H-hydrate epimerase
MKLLTAQHIRDWDQFTIKNEPILSINLMERASIACVEPIKRVYAQGKLADIVVFCGSGNNGGDGFAAARLLKSEGYPVQVFQLSGNKLSPDCEHNSKRWTDEANGVITLLNSLSDFPVISDAMLVIDALFGTGLNKPISGLHAELITYINTGNATVVSIDIPSGLFAEFYEPTPNQAIIAADYTLTFEVPKLSFLLPDTGKYCGKVEIIPIGLSAGYLDSINSSYTYINDVHVKSRPKFAHKGTFGHALVIGGSWGKMGAVVLMSRAALRSGCGLVTAYVPKVGYTIIQSAIPECMVSTDDELYELRKFPLDIDSYNAIGVGPGMGTHELTKKAFLYWLTLVEKPLVIDADGINIIADSLAEFRNNFKFPAHCVITPHPKEFDRLAGFSRTSYERLQKQIRFAQEYQVVVVLKGMHTSIATPDGKVYFNSTGNAAMATAGSGDVLTGVIASLLAQGYSETEAAILGVYMHGKAGDQASADRSSIIAGDIVEQLGR